MKNDTNIRDFKREGRGAFVIDGFKKKMDLRRVYNFNYDCK
jgi:hypothetical protein